jgi:hypothetical protein
MLVGEKFGRFDAAFKITFFGAQIVGAAPGIA